MTQRRWLLSFFNFVLSQSANRLPTPDQSHQGGLSSFKLFNFFHSLEQFQWLAELLRGCHLAFALKNFALIWFSEARKYTLLAN